jgi:hypothetical protein
MQTHQVLTCAGETHLTCKGEQLVCLQMPNSRAEQGGRPAGWRVYSFPVPTLAIPRRVSVQLCAMHTAVFLPPLIRPTVFASIHLRLMRRVFALTPAHAVTAHAPNRPCTVCSHLHASASTCLVLLYVLVSHEKMFCIGYQQQQQSGTPDKLEVSKVKRGRAATGNPETPIRNPCLTPLPPSCMPPPYPPA